MDIVLKDYFTFPFNWIFLLKKIQPSNSVICALILFVRKLNARTN